MKSIVSIGRAAMPNLAIVSLCAVAAALSLTVYAQESRTVSQGVYSVAQAGRGQALFTANCAVVPSLLRFSND